MDPQELYGAFVEMAKVSIRDNAESYRRSFRKNQSDPTTTLQKNSWLYKAHSIYVDGINDMLECTAIELNVEFSELERGVRASVDGLPIFK